jgi:hypothetical protein
MKRFKPLMLKVWRPYLILGLMQLVSIILCSSAWQFYRHHTDEAQRLRLQLSEVKKEQKTWLNQQALLNHYLPRYQTLMQSNNISQPQPQLWLRQLKHIQQSQHLFPVQYTMSKPQPYKMGFEGVQAVASNMNLEMALLHEEDLLTLLQALKASHTGGFILRSCKLNTLSATLEMQQLNPSLHAKCMLDWINILPVTD